MRSCAVHAFAAAAAAIAAAASAGAATIVTSDAGAVGAFVGSLAPIGFDDVPSSLIIPGTVIPAQSQISTQYQGLGVLISSSGGPAFASNSPGDATSQPSLLGGTSLFGGQLVIDYLQPLTLDFVLPGSATPGVTDLVGAWLDPMGSVVELAVFDANGDPLESADR
jgi:hypothetical protein